MCWITTYLVYVCICNIDRIWHLQKSNWFITHQTEYKNWVLTYKRINHRYRLCIPLKWIYTIQLWKLWKHVISSSLTSMQVCWIKRRPLIMVIQLPCRSCFHRHQASSAIVCKVQQRAMSSCALFLHYYPDTPSWSCSPKSFGCRLLVNKVYGYLNYKWVAVTRMNDRMQVYLK